MMNPEEEFRQFKRYQRELLQAAHMDRLRRHTKTRRDPLIRRLLLLLGNAMIDGGIRIKRSVQNTPAPGALNRPEAQLEFIRKL